MDILYTILYPIVPKLTHILEPSSPNVLPQFESETRRSVALVTHVESSVQSHATFHQQKNLLALARFRYSTAVHQLEHVGLHKAENELNWGKKVQERMNGRKRMRSTLGERS